MALIGRPRRASGCGRRSQPPRQACQVRLTCETTDSPGCTKQSGASSRPTPQRLRRPRRRARAHGQPCPSVNFVSVGLHDALTDEAFAVIDALTAAPRCALPGDRGRCQRAGCRLRWFGGPDDPRPMLILASRSDMELDRQVTAPGPTWLDERLIEPLPTSCRIQGQESEFGEAQHHLIIAWVVEQFDGPPEHAPQGSTE
jgi:hypothetical protein